MTDEEYRQRIIASEQWITLDLERKQRELLCKLQARNRTYVKNPGLVTYTLAYEDLVTEAKERMKRDADVIEKQFYAELDDEE